MSIILDDYALPEKGNVVMKIDRSFEIKVTAQEAKVQVGLWLHQNVSYLISTDAPSLVIGERVIWRVPAWIGLPHIGRLGTVGMFEVDVETGQMNNLEKIRDNLLNRLEELKLNIPPYIKPAKLNLEYLSLNTLPISSPREVVETMPVSDDP